MAQLHTSLVGRHASFNDEQYEVVGVLLTDLHGLSFILERDGELREVHFRDRGFKLLPQEFTKH